MSTQNEAPPTAKLNVELSIQKRERKFTATITAASGANIVISANGPEQQFEEAIHLLFDTLCGVTDRETAIDALQSVETEVALRSHQQ